MINQFKMQNIPFDKICQMHILADAQYFIIFKMYNECKLAKTWITTIVVNVVVTVIFAVIIIIAAIVVIIVDGRVPVPSFQLRSRYVTSLFCCNICITMILIIAISGTAFGNAVSHSQVCNIWFCFWLTGTRGCISTNRCRLWAKASCPWQRVCICLVPDRGFVDVFW